MNKMLLCPDTAVSPNITYSDNSSCQEMIWETGSLIEREEYNLGRLEFICEDLPAGHFPDFAVSDLGCPIVSKRFKDCLDHLRVENVEYFPAAVIETKDGPPRTGYFAANIIGLINCIDLEKSDIDGKEVNGEIVAIRYINKLVLNDKDNFGAIYRAYLFRRLIIVEEPLIANLRGQNIEGIKFIDPGKWDGFYGEK